ncbi:N-acetylmuramoyl-L-alanine amidase family protein [Clostridium saccharoperbutylacetonicum]|uniref:N-acetylmuramoyl-L-alanine amidase family protein n=1 Tax=Clostridium saccharoperbutylacetonicum TaxID=36745 RepID=UPI0039ECE975
MREMKKRFVALLIVFTSIVSFLPVGFSGHEAKAAVSDASAIQVSIAGDKNLITPRNDATLNETIYSTQNVVGGFDITVKDVRTTIDALQKLAKDTKTSTSDITQQNVEIVSINGTPVTDTATLNEIGITISDYQIVNGAVPSVGKTINNLPLGVNKIQYKISFRTQNIDFVPASKSLSGVDEANVGTYKDTEYASQTITIEHATDFVVNKINPMTFKAYVGSQNSFDNITNAFIGTASEKVNNTTPFLYIQDAKADSSMALRYTFDVPDSVSALKYVMTFENTMNLENAMVYKNGKKATIGTEYNIDGQQLTGSLAKLGQPESIVVKLDSGSGANKDIQKAYAIEIRYKNLNSNNDYSLKDAGITKLNYNDNTDVQAYVGKVFNVSQDKNAIFKTYKGDIYIDQRAGMVSLDPTLLRDKATVGYVLTNNYTDSTGKTQVVKSELKNGKQFIDFKASTTANELQLDVYAASNGEITDTQTILARYLFKVNIVNSSNFDMNLSFDVADNSSSTAKTPYLTQPGTTNLIDKFYTSRRTYDLYYGSPNSDSVKVSLDKTKRSNLNEYTKVWLADDVNSNNLTEATASVNNKQILATDGSGNYVRDTDLNVKIGTAKKMVVQAYYDEFTYVTDSSGNKVIKTNSDGEPIYTSEPIGDTYVFYLPENYGNQTNPNQGQKSDNAVLNSLKVKGYSLTNSNGTTGFSSTDYNYNVTVAKEDTTEKFTVIAQDANIASITATINNGDQSYTLPSGEETELPLDSSGTTKVKIVVTAQDGTTTKTYTVTLTNNNKSSDAALKNVILNTGDYTFDPTADITKVRVDTNVTNIKVTPVPKNSNSTITVNGQNYSDTAISVSLRGNQKTQITIEVKSEDGASTKTYTLEVYRVDNSDWNDNNNNNNTDDDQFYDDFNDTWVDLSKYEEWGTVNGKPAYFDKHNRQVKNAWITTGSKNYYLNNIGFRASGWKVDNTDGKTYYLDPTTGEMRMGWINVDNKVYYLGKNGVMHKGWLNLNGKWYYFTPNGQMVINQGIFIDDRVYTFGQDGAASW